MSVPGTTDQNSAREISAHAPKSNLMARETNPPKTHKKAVEVRRLTGRIEDILKFTSNTGTDAAEKLHEFTSTLEKFKADFDKLIEGEVADDEMS